MDDRVGANGRRKLVLWPGFINYRVESPLCGKIHNDCFGGRAMSTPHSIQNPEAVTSLNDMTPRVVLLLVLMGTAAAQGSAPTVPPEKVPFCGGMVNGIVNPPCTTQPRPIYSPDPKYPRKQAKVHLPGTVQLATVVGPDGLPSDIAVSSSLSP